MNPKSFDINAPSRINPSATSRPVIVGHRPVMTDPMMRPPQTSLPSTNSAPQPAPAPAHVPRVIAVSDEVKNDLAASQATSPASYTPPAPAMQPEAFQTPVPAAAPAGIGGPGPVNPALAVPPPAAPEPDLSHLPHVPIAHPHHQHAHLKTMVLWVVIIGFLLAFTAYLLIDSGLITSSINLPFHIFNKS